MEMVRSAIFGSVYRILFLRLIKAKDLWGSNLGFSIVAEGVRFGNSSFPISESESGKNRVATFSGKTIVLFGEKLSLSENKTKLPISTGSFFNLTREDFYIIMES